MAATITGIVFNDLNLNGLYDPGEPGIPGAYVVLYGADGCTTVQTDAGGNYSFSAIAGTYTIYEPVVSPNACPPTAFTQPAGFNVSNGPRKRTVTVTASQSNSGATISGQNFSHALNNENLECDAEMIQFAGNPTVWYNIDLVTGASVPQGPLTPAHYVNAIGFNSLGNFLYGYDQTSNHIVRIDANGVITTLLPNPPGLPVTDYTTGAFDANGFFYLYATNEARYYTVDLRPNSATYLKLVNPTAGYVEQTSNYGTQLSTPIDVSDWAVNPLDGNLYGVNRSGNVDRVVPTTGAVTVLTTTGPKEPADTSYGASAFDFNGNLYAIANSSGIIRRYTIAGNTASGEIFSQSVATSNNDGAMCYFATIDVDFGDAPDLGGGNGPDNYNTLLQNNGPRHGIINALFLGTRVTAEQDALQNADATGDDIPRGIPDDGLAVPLEPIYSGVGTYVLDVTVTNQTDQTANLYGWIDFNQNGLFESGEAAPVVQIPPQAGTQVYQLEFAVPSGTLASGHTFVRLRLTTDTLIDEGGIQDTRSVGAARDGEVEDYIVGVSGDADLSVVKTGSPKPVMVGDVLTYTIVINNAGPSETVNTVLTDSVPPELTDVEFSVDGGFSWQPWTGSYALGNLAAGETRIIYIRGTVSFSATGSIENTAVITSDTPDPDPGNNSSTDVTEVVDSADLEVTKTGEPNPVMTGQFLTYTIKVNNFGPSDAQDVTLTDELPPQLLNPEYSLDGVTWLPFTGTLNLGTIASGNAIPVLVRGIVAPNATGVIVNTVRVDSPTPDPNPGNNQDTELTPIQNAADLSVTKTGSPKPVLNGETLIYGIVITNNGPDTAMNTVLTDAVPSSLTNVEYSTDGGTSWQPWTGSYPVGDLAPGETREIFIRGIVAGSANGTIENTATVSSDTPDPNPDNNSDTDITPVNRAANLSVTKTASPVPVAAGEQLTYTITIFNAGPDPAENTVLTDVVPGELLEPEFAVQGSPNFSPWVSPYTVGTLGSGESFVVTIRGTVAPGTAAGSVLSNTALVTSDTPDPDPEDNSDTVEVPVEVSADLAVTKRANTDTAVPGEVLTYTITVTNLGPSDAQSVTLIDAVPSGLSNPEFSTDGGATWNPWVNPYALGSLAAGSGTDILLRGTLSTAATGTVVNTATVTSSTPDPNPNNNTDTDETPIEPQADISVIKTAAPNPVATGFPVTYTLVIQNFGPATAQNVLLTDALPAGTTGAEFSTNGGASWTPWTGTYQLGDLPSSSTVTILLRATVTAGADTPLSNTAVVSSDTPDPNPDNNTSTAEVDVEESADLSVIKTAAPDPVLPGDLLTYTLDIQNLGPGDAQNVLVEDAVPPELTGVEYSLDGGVTWQPWTGSYQAGTLAGGGSLTILIRGTVPEDAAGAIQNTAVVSGDTPDPNPDNNTSTEVTCVCPGAGTGSADLSVVKTAQSSPVLPGAELIYTLTVRNNGPDTAENVFLYDRIPSALLNPEYSVDGGATWLPWTNPHAIGSLDAEASVELLIRGQVSPNATGTIENTALVTSDTPDPYPGDNTSTVEVPIAPNADLMLVKTAFPQCATRCEPLFFRLTVSNFGTDTAENVLLTDTVPDGLCNVQSSTDQGRTWRPWNGVIGLGSVPPRTTVTVLLRGIVSGCASGIITNIARVTSTTPDLDMRNNIGVANVPIGNCIRCCPCEEESGDCPPPDKGCGWFF